MQSNSSQINTQQNQTNNSHTFFEQQQPILFNNKNNEYIYLCPHSSPGFRICVNQNCLQPCPYTCINPQCKCHDLHDLCPNVNIKQVFKKIQSKIINTMETKEKIEKIVDDSIDKLSELRDNVLEEVQKKYKYSMMTEVEREFLKIRENNDLSIQFKGKKRAELIKSLVINSSSHQESSNSLKEQLFELLNKASSQILQKAKQQLQKTFKTSQTTEKQLNQVNLQKQKEKEKKYVQNLSIKMMFQDYLSKAEVSKQFMNNSLVLKQSQHIETLIKFLPQIKSVKLLYRASQNQFSMKQYFKKCGDQKHTVILCQTIYDKIIGGYTPLKFYPNYYSDPNKIYDNSKTSCIFSLTNKQKFYLNSQNNQAITVLSSDYCINMGNQEFVIGSTNPKQSNGKIGKTYMDTNIDKRWYHHQKYEHLPSSKTTAQYKDPRRHLYCFQGPNYSGFYQRFNGGKKQEFQIKQWQVWKIQLKKI